MRLVLLCSLLGSVSYSLLMPTIWEYLRVSLHITNKMWLGVVIATFTVWRTVAFPFVGVWSDRRGFREPYTLCCVAAVAGGIMYAVAGHYHSLPLLVAGRSLMGVSGASMTLNSAYIARTTPPERLTRAMALNQGWSLVGNVVAYIYKPCHDTVPYIAGGAWSAMWWARPSTPGWCRSSTALRASAWPATS